MVIDRPMRENDIGLLSRDNACECTVSLSVDHRLTVDLARECGASFQNPARLPRFGGPDRGAPIKRSGAAEALTAIEVQKHDFVTEIAETRDRACAAALRIAGMTAGYNNLQLRRGLSEGGKSGGRGDELPARYRH